MKSAGFVSYINRKMNKKTLSILILLVFIIIIAVIIIDFTTGKPDKRGDNPYAYDVEEYREVDESLIHYTETRNFTMSGSKASAIDYYNGNLYIAGEGFLQVITINGRPLNLIKTEGKPECVHAGNDLLFLGFQNSVRVLDLELKTLISWEIPGEKTLLTSIAVKKGVIFIADAGNRRVLRYNFQGELLGQFEGKRESQAGHGFIIPSANFDLVVNKWGELWVVNPGQHSVENYSDEGEIRGYWTKSSMDTDGFIGCCNPAEMAVMEDGSFITSEKGMVRIKIYNPSGTLKSVVAPPSSFIEEGQAPEIVSDENNVIYALDFNRNIIRVFEPKEL